MIIYKIKDCYIDNKKTGIVLPYSADINTRAIGHYGVIEYLKYIFINSSLTRKTANKKLVKYNRKLYKNRTKELL